MKKARAVQRQQQGLLRRVCSLYRSHSRMAPHISYGTPLPLFNMFCSCMIDAGESRFRVFERLLFSTHPSKADLSTSCRSGSGASVCYGVDGETK